jgi:acetate kinase
VDARPRRGPPRRPGLDLDLVVLVVNAGSTSLKLHLVAGDEATPVESFDVRCDAVGHRIVHLGELVVDTVPIDDDVLRHVEQGAEIAPLHNRPALEGIAKARAALPDVPHVAVSDSWFHAHMPEEARRYAVPEEWRERGVVRHGFHGLAVESVTEQVGAPRLVVCHLGGGCSVTAVKDGRSVDTSMGLTPLEGIPMVTRSGSIDPGALLYLLRAGLDVDRLDHALNEESGLTALGGLDDPFVVSYFAYHVAKAVAAMAAVLGGVDAIAFSGGIGEHRADVREAILERVAFLAAEAHVVPAREELVIARHVRAVLGRG